MNHTPTKQPVDIAKKVKSTGKRIPQNEPAQPNAGENQAKGRLASLLGWIKEHYLITTIVAACIVLTCLLTPIIVLFTQSRSEVVIVYGPSMTTPLKSGGTYTSQTYSLTKNSKNMDVSVNSISSNKRLLQEGVSGDTSINYYHKDSQISVSFNNNLQVQIRIPVDTGINYAISDAPDSSEESLKKLPEVLPGVLTAEVEKSVGGKATVKTEISYDAFYDNKTQQYTILTQNKSYHPDQFATITPNQINLCDNKPKVTNYNDVQEVSKAVSQTTCNIATNFKKVIIENKQKVEQLAGTITEKTDNSGATVVSSAPSASQPTQCTRIGPDLLRCSKDTWQSCELNVTNKNPVDPIEVLELVIETK